MSEGGETRDASDIGDAERKNIALGEGPRVNLDDSDGRKLVDLIKERVKVEVEEMKAKGDMGSEGEAGLVVKFGVGGLKL